MTSSPDIDQIAQEIRRVNGNHSLGAGALAEALMPFIATALLAAEKRGEDREREKCAKIADGFICGLCGMDGKAGAAIRSSGGGNG